MSNYTPAKRKEFYAHTALAAVMDSDTFSDRYLEPDNAEMIGHLKMRFNAEYGDQMVARYGSHVAAVENWLRGLALSIPFSDYDICQISEILGYSSTGEANQSRCVEYYWRSMAQVVSEMIRGLYDPSEHVVRVAAFNFDHDMYGNPTCQYSYNGRTVTKRRRQCGYGSDRMDWAQCDMPRHKMSNVEGRRSDGEVTATFTFDLTK